MRACNLHNIPFRKLDCLTGWLLAAVSLTVYLLTVEPGVSYWDCPEYVLGAYRLEIGHPPGNPAFQLAARAFITLLSPFAGAALAVNLMNCLASALTVLLLYRSISLITRRVLCPGGEMPQGGSAAVVIGSGICGALIFAFCDSFWFSAVEAEVYALSSFCTALIVWVMLKWADTPPASRRDSMIILAAYLTGLSVGVHELNLLCIPALCLIVMYAVKRRCRPRLVTGVLMLSILLIASVLFGAVPGMMEYASQLEILFVNRLHLPMHSGVAAYALLLAAVYACAAAAASKGSLTSLRILFIAALAAGGYLFIGRSLYALAAAVMLLSFAVWRAPEIFTRRVMGTAVWCAMSLTAGFSVYLLVPIRAAANPPVNTGNPSDIFAFDTYFSREQYGSRPLLYGRSPYSQRMRAEAFDSIAGAYDYSRTWYSEGRMRYRAAEDGYLPLGPRHEYRYTPELDMVFPRLASGRQTDIEAYRDWAGMTPETMARVRVTEAVDSAGRNVAKVNPVDGKRAYGSALKPTQWHNLRYFGTYQTAYMYLRYLLWNFAGRQNDIHSQGQVDAGNFITGFDTLDNAMLGSVSTPEDIRTGFRGRHNYFLLPLLFAAAGMVWLGRRGRTGRRASFTIAVLFVMTGFAIVVYLNQTPCEPRERDYAFAGSYYAFAMWCGCGVAMLASLLRKVPLIRKQAACAALLLGIVPGAVVCAQNWRDHDRSNRTAAADFARLYLESAEKDAILFVNGDNYTFPLWYAQEVEGIRRDVRIVNLAYLATPWYSAQLLLDGEVSPAPALTATGKAFADNRFVFALIPPADTDTADAVEALRSLYSSADANPSFPSRYVRIRRRNGSQVVDLKEFADGKGVVGLQKIMILDLIASNAVQKHPRPVYFMPNLPASSMIPLRGHLVCDGLMVRESRDTILISAGTIDAGRAYRLFTGARSWGGMDIPGVYADGATAEQVVNIRRSILQAARSLFDSGDMPRSRRLLMLALGRLRAENVPYRISNPATGTFSEAAEAASLALDIAAQTRDEALRRRAVGILRDEIEYAAASRAYVRGLPPHLRGTVSPSVLASGRDLPRSVAIYRAQGLDPAPILRRHGITASDEKELARAFLRREALFRMIRQNSADDSSLSAYFKNGGDTASLLKYPSLGISLGQ